MSEAARPPLSREEFIDWVRREGEIRYHDHHRYCYLEFGLCHRDR